MPDLPTSTDVRQRLGDAAAKLADLRNRPNDQRGDSYAADLKLAADTVLDLDGQLRTAQALEAYDLQAAAWDAAVAQEERKGKGPNPLGPGAAFEQLTRDARSVSAARYAARRRCSSAHFVTAEATKRAVGWSTTWPRAAKKAVTCAGVHEAAARASETARMKARR